MRGHHAVTRFRTRSYGTAATWVETLPAWAFCRLQEAGPGSRPGGRQLSSSTQSGDRLDPWAAENMDKCIGRSLLPTQVKVVAYYEVAYSDPRFWITYFSDKVNQ